MEETRVPVYLITGFLESGKTSFLSFTLQQDYFQIDGKTLLILCEEGEEEYDEEALKQCNTVVEIIDSEEELTPERLAAMEILHQPARVEGRPIPFSFNASLNSSLSTSLPAVSMARSNVASV